MGLKITIDPGHGQYDNKSSNNVAYIEGTQMWHLANKLKAALEAYGFEVVTTRPKITDDPSLSDRGGASGKNGSCMFLSLHSNTPGKSADGTYIKTCTGTVVYYSMTRVENLPLADKLGNKVSEIMGHYYRGSKTREYPNKPGVDYYGVIRSAAESGCKCAMLIEHGFHTNVEDSNFLLDESNQKKLAEAEAAIIAEYFDQNKTDDPASTIIYRVQVGAYAKKENATNMLTKLKAAGFDACITTTQKQAEVVWPTVSTKTVDKLAKDVINGKWGNGSERKRRLTEAGYDYAAIQKRVNQLL